ncbi:MAG TPA: class II fumarate hydratase [Gammaproteobacteria bacterium]|nr:class II fumarate hydratase [Gammaproteobacteria bacterium]
MSKVRIEKDSMGELEVPADALYGAQTQRAINNFPVSGLVLPRAFISALGLVKVACAKVNLALSELQAPQAEAIISAASQVSAGEVDGQFPIDIFQTGSGTSTNMNANEVISRLASEASGLTIHPNDHVNMGQSSNDVIPTVIHVSASLQLAGELIPALGYLKAAIDRRCVELDTVIKTGRTHLMDAMPVKLSQEMGGWSAQLGLGIERLQACMPRISALVQGGTAVGTGINAHEQFAEKFAAQMSELTGHPFTSNPNKFEGLSAQDAAVELSGQLKTIAVSLMKISNDLRWMNSGPLAGLGEIALPALQPGSSIMPGKVNPVIPESMAMVCAQVIGNDTTITVGGQAGNFQLNVMLPVIAYNLLQSIEILANGCRMMADKAIDGFRVNQQNIDVALARNPILVTALNPVTGYELGAKIAKTAYAEGRAVVDVAEQMTDLSREELEALLSPEALTRGGITK